MRFVANLRRNREDFHKLPPMRAPGDKPPEATAVWHGLQVDAGFRPGPGTHGSATDLVVATLELADVGALGLKRRANHARPTVRLPGQPLHQRAGLLELAPEQHRRSRA